MFYGRLSKKVLLLNVVAFKQKNKGEKNRYPYRFRPGTTIGLFTQNMGCTLSTFLFCIFDTPSFI